MFFTTRSSHLTIFWVAPQPMPIGKDLGGGGRSATDCHERLINFTQLKLKQVRSNRGKTSGFCGWSDRLQVRYNARYLFTNFANKNSWHWNRICFFSALPLFLNHWTTEHVLFIRVRLFCFVCVGGSVREIFFAENIKKPSITEPLKHFPRRRNQARERWIKNGAELFFSVLSANNYNRLNRSAAAWSLLGFQVELERVWTRARRPGYHFWLKILKGQLKKALRALILWSWHCRFVCVAN